MIASHNQTDWNSLNNALSIAVLERGLLDEILEDLGCKRSCWSGRNTNRWQCPIHEGNKPNLWIKTGGYALPIRWMCFSGKCHLKNMPNLLGLVRGILSAQKGRKVRLCEVVDFLAQYVGDFRVTRKYHTASPKSEPEAKLLNLNRKTVRRVLTIPSRYFLSRGYSREVLDAFDVGDSSHPKMKTRAVVPLYDEDGQVCIGYAARSKLPECDQCDGHHFGTDCRYKSPKWKVPGDFPTTHYLFNYARAKATDAPFIFLVEGAGDVLRLAEAGYVGVALLGSAPSEEHVRKLAALEKEVWVGFDNDPGGKEARELLRQREKSAGIELPCVSFEAPAPYNDIGETPVASLRQAIRQALDSLVKVDEMLSGGSDDEYLKKSRKRLQDHEEWLKRSPASV